MKKIRIAYLSKENSNNKKSWSGTTYAIGECLKNAGFEVDKIHSLSCLYEKYLKVIEKIFFFFNIKFDPERSILLSKILSKIIEKKLSNIQYDLIITHNSTLISYIKTNIPIILWTDLTFDLYQKTYFSNFYEISKKSGNFLEKLSLNKAKIIIYPSNYAKINAVTNYRISKSKIKIIPFGANIKTINKKQFSANLKIRVKNLKKKVKILSIGVDWKRKNMEKNIQVIKELNKIGIKSELTIIGTNPPENYLLPNFIKIIPNLNKEIKLDEIKLSNFFLNNHFLLHLSNAEAYGLVFREANNFGLPIITHNRDGIRFAVDKKYSVINSHQCNAINIAKSIKSLVLKKSFYKMLSNNSYKNSKKINWKNSSINLKKLVKQILKKN